MPAVETLVPFPEDRDKIPPVTQVRSTLLGSSLLALRERGLESRYLAHLPEAHKDTLLYMHAGTWVGVDVAEAHYGACDAMMLSQPEILAVGNVVGKLLTKASVALVTRLATEGGATPWSLLQNAQRYWGRSYVGSAVGVFKLGPKEGRLEVVANQLASFAYWRVALRGILTEMCGAFCRTVYVREESSRAKDAVTYRMSWV